MPSDSPYEFGSSGLVDINYVLPNAALGVFGGALPNVPPLPLHNDVIGTMVVMTLCWIVFALGVRFYLAYLSRKRGGAGLRYQPVPAEQRGGDVAVIVMSGSEAGADGEGTTPSAAKKYDDGFPPYGTKRRAASSSSRGTTPTPTELKDVVVDSANSSINGGGGHTASLASPRSASSFNNSMNTMPVESSIVMTNSNNNNNNSTSAIINIGSSSAAVSSSAPTSASSAAMMATLVQNSGFLHATAAPEGPMVVTNFSLEYTSRILSLVHGVVSTLMALHNMIIRYQQSSTTAGYLTNIVCLNEPPLVDEQLLALFVCSYFMYDTIGIITGDYFDFSFLMHHVGALTILSTSLLGVRLGQEMSVGLFILESTSPQLHIRWLLQYHGYDLTESGKRSLLWWFSDVGFLIAFAFVRLFIGLVALVMFSQLVCPTASPIVVFVLIIIFVCSSSFFKNCLVKARKGERWIA